MGGYRKADSFFIKGSKRSLNNRNGIAIILSRHIIASFSNDFAS